MESQLQHTHESHGQHFDEHDALKTAGPHTGDDQNEDEHRGEKKSVMKKVKAKAKKLKNTITGHGHGPGHGGDDHHHDDDEDDDDDEEETVEDPEVHGSPMYDSSRVVGVGGPDANLAQPRGNLERPSHLGGPDVSLAQPRGNLERPSAMAEDRYASEPVARHGAQPPPLSTGPIGTNLAEPGLGHPNGHGQELNPQQRRGKIGQSTGMDENPVAADPTYGTTPVSNPVGYHGQGQDVNQDGLRGSIGKTTGTVRDPHAPKDPSLSGSDPSNDETKVTKPTHIVGKEAELSKIQHSFDKMGIRDKPDSGSHGPIGSDPKSFDPNHPENLPRETLTGNQSNRSSSYAEKISSSASASADKAAVAKDVIASKLGYSGQAPTSESNEPVKKSGSATDYTHKITDMVTGTLTPVYEKVVGAGSSVMSKMQGTVSPGSGTGHPKVQRGSDTSVETTTVDEGKGGDKGVSVKEYLVETLRPGDEDKALSETITQAFHRGNDGESERKSGEDSPQLGRVTESAEVRERLGTDHTENQQQQQQHSSNVNAEKGVADRLKDAVGSWFGGKGDAPQGTLGTSYVTDEGLSSSPGGEGKGGSGGGR